VKQMGADIVIGVHLSTGPVDPNSFNSLLSVAGGSIEVMISANELRGMELADILLTADVSGYSTLDFSRAQEIVPKGRAAAEAKSQLLSSLSVSDEAWHAYLAERDARKAKPTAIPGFIEVTGTTPGLQRDIRDSLAGYVGQPIDTTRLENDLRRLTGLGRFNRLSYSLIERNGKPGLLIAAEEKDYAPPFLNPGFVIDGSDPANVQFQLSGRLTFLDVGGYRSEVRTDFSLGSVYSILGEYYHPLTPASRWFVAPQAGASSTAFNIYSGSQLVAQYRFNQVFAGVDLGYNFDRFSEVRLGYETGHESVTRQIGMPDLPTVSGRRGATRLRYVMDRLDSPVVPRRGAAIWSNVQWVDANPGATAGFPAAQLGFEAFHPVSQPGSFYVTGEGGTTFNHRQTGIPQFSLGGPNRLSAYGTNEFLTNQYFFFQLGYLHRLAQLPPFLGKGIYADGVYELGKAYYIPNVSKLPNDLAAGVVVETLIGPAFIGAAYGDTGHQKWFFRIGRVF